MPNRGPMERCKRYTRLELHLFTVTSVNSIVNEARAINGEQRSGQRVKTIARQTEARTHRFPKSGNINPGREETRTKNAPEPHIPVGSNALYTRTHTYIFSTHRAHVALPVNVRSGRQRGGGFGGGSEGIAVTGRQGGMVVTRTGHCHPRGYRRHDPPFPCKITLCRARWEITFCPSITG